MLTCFSFFPLPLVGAYNTSSNPYASIQYTTLGNHSTNQQASTMGLHGAALSSNPYSTDIPASRSSLHSGANYGIYASTSRSSLTNQFIGVPAFANWASTAPPLLSTSTPSSRAGGNTGPTLHSPLTAQVYSADPSSLRGQATLEMTESGPYALSQASPDQMIPECASAEPSKLNDS